MERLADNGPVGYFLCALMIEIDITAAGTHDGYHGSWRRIIQPSLLCPVLGSHAVAPSSPQNRNPSFLEGLITSHIQSPPFHLSCVNLLFLSHT